jgi:hypothetical protein
MLISLWHFRCLRMDKIDVINYEYVIKLDNIRSKYMVLIPQLISITHSHISLVWEVNFVLFNSMLKYVINRLMHVFFRYRSLGMITVLIYFCSDICLYADIAVALPVFTYGQN